MKRMIGMIAMFGLLGVVGNPLVGQDDPQPTLCVGDFQSEEEARQQIRRLSETWKGDPKLWRDRAAAIRKQILHGSGLDPLPAKSALNPIIRKRRNYDGYSAESVAFEALPGFYVYGSLYRPQGSSGRTAAVLCPHGHYVGPEGGRFRPDHQHRCATLARMGAVVLSWDMIGFGESESIGWRHTHSQAMTLQIWSSIRAIDFLLELPEVDPRRIAITGSSGGGTQSFLLAAVDDRIAVSVPVVMVSAHFFGGCHCESGMPIHKTESLETNNAEIAALVAPRPMLLVSVGKDWTKNTPQVEFPYIQSVYRALGAVERVENKHLPDEDHGYQFAKRQAVYPFLARHLKLDPRGVLDEQTGLFDETGNTIESVEIMRVFDAALPPPPTMLLPGTNVPLSPGKGLTTGVR